MAAKSSGAALITLADSAYLSPSSFHHSGFRHLGCTPAAAASHSPSKDVKMELLGMTFTAFKTCAKTANCGDRTERSGLGAYAEGNPR